MSKTREAPLTLQSLTRPELIFPGLSGADRGSILRELSARLAARGIVDDGAALYRLLQEREDLGSTGIGASVAVPHCKIKGLEKVVLAVGISGEAIDYESADGAPVRVFFVVLSPPNQPAAHLQSLAAISRWVQGENHLQGLLASGDAEEIFALLRVDENGD